MWWISYKNIRWIEKQIIHIQKELVHGAEKKKCKGVKKSVIESNTKVKEYIECLFSEISQLKTMNTIRSRGHNLGTETINKTALSANDDKRVISTLWD